MRCRVQIPCHPEGDEAHGATFRHEKVVQPIAVGKAVLQWRLALGYGLNKGIAIV